MEDVMVMEACSLDSPLNNLYTNSTSFHIKFTLKNLVKSALSLRCIKCQWKTSADFSRYVQCIYNV